MINMLNVRHETDPTVQRGSFDARGGSTYGKLAQTSGQSTQVHLESSPLSEQFRGRYVRGEMSPGMSRIAPADVFGMLI